MAKSIISDPGYTGRTEPVPQLVFKTDGRQYYPFRETTPAADAFIKKLSFSPAKIELTDGSGRLPWELDFEKKSTSLSAGDVVLSDADRLTVCFADMTSVCERLARLDMPPEELKKAFGAPGTKICVFVEWSE